MAKVTKKRLQFFYLISFVVLLKSDYSTSTHIGQRIPTKSSFPKMLENSFLELNSFTLTSNYPFTNIF
jgi:hypothetical protein